MRVTGLKGNALGTKQRDAIIDALYEHGPMSINEIADVIDSYYTSVRYHLRRLLSTGGLVRVLRSNPYAHLYMLLEHIDREVDGMIIDKHGAVWPKVHEPRKINV